MSEADWQEPPRRRGTREERRECVEGILRGATVLLAEARALRQESLTQSKTAPSLAKRKGPGALAVAALDAVNVAWTNAFGSAGDRCTLVARK